MRHEITTLNTKKAIAASLKKLVAQKPFSKVSVSEIISDCDVNRKTFYYHFEDIYSLLKWTLEQEAIDVVKNFDLIAEYEETIYFIMDYIEKNNDFLLNVYNSVGREELKRFFYLDFVDMVTSIVDYAEKEINLYAPVDFKRFLVNFYTEALAGNLIEWIANHDDSQRQKTVEYIRIILKGSLPGTIKEACLNIPN